MSDESRPSPVTIALLFDNFGPYHFARLRGAQDILGKERVVGLQVRRKSIDYEWQTSSAQEQELGLETILPTHGGPFFFGTKSWHVWQYLDRMNPEAVAIAGYAAEEMLAALAWCRWHKRAAVLVSESKEDDIRRYWWKEHIKKRVLRFYDSALVGGHPQRRYMQKLGLPQEAIFTQINVVGNDDYHPAKIAGLKTPLSNPFFLLVNRFVEKKNLRFVLDCYAQYRRRLSEKNEIPWDLVLAGDGELRAALQSQATALGVNRSVHFPGFLQQKELLPYLAHCAVFIHASTTEQWGLVVNEAMAAGRPVFVSRKCGCFEDLIIDGITGLGFDPFSQAELVDLMVKATTGQLPLATLGAAGLRHIDQFSPASFGRTLGIAVDYAIERSRSRG